MEDQTNPQNQTSAQDPQAGAGSSSSGASQNKNDLSGIMEQNVDIGSLVSNAGNKDQIEAFVKWAKENMPEHPQTQFNNDEFIALLAGSISLTHGEKQGIITNVPKLTQFQIDELMKIFKEEQQKFTELEKKHAEEMAKLEAQYSSGENEKQKEEVQQAKEADLDAAEELKRKLMGGGA